MSEDSEDIIFSISEFQSSLILWLNACCDSTGDILLIYWVWPTNWLTSCDYIRLYWPGSCHLAFFYCEIKWLYFCIIRGCTITATVSGWQLHNACFCQKHFKILKLKIIITHCQFQVTFKSDMMKYKMFGWTDQTDFITDEHSWE